MFVLRDQYEFSATVKVRVPTESGVVDQAFDGRFKVVRTDDVKACYAAARTVEEGDAAVLSQALIGWSDMTDDTNAPVPFSEDTRDRLLAISFVRRAIADAYGQAVGGEPSRRE